MRAGALEPRAQAAEPAFGSNPFTLGVASGYPEPAAVVLWTRLAPEPLDDVARADSGTRVLASFAVADGKPGAIRG